MTCTYLEYVLLPTRPGQPCRFLAFMTTAGGEACAPGSAGRAVVGAAGRAVAASAVGVPPGFGPAPARPRGLFPAAAGELFDR